MKKLVCNMTSVCKPCLSEDMLECLHKLVGKENDEKLAQFVEVLSSTTIPFDTDHYSNIPFEEIQEGDIIIADIAKIMSMSCLWRHIRIDHIYRDTVFYTVLADNVKEKEGSFKNGSLFFHRQIYPCYIIRNKDYNILCDCPLVEIVDSLDEISEDCRVYDYKIREETDY